MGIRSFKYQLASASERSKRYSERHFKLFGVIGVFVIPATTLVERVVADPSFNTLYVRAIAALFALPLLFHDQLPRSIERCSERIWILSISVLLPTSFGAILTLNAALTPAGSVLSPIWIYQYLVALFIFIQLINHGPLSILLWLATAIPLILIVAGVESPNIQALKDAWLYPFPVYLTLLIIGSLTNRNVHAIQSEQLRAASAIGGNIAHELRTPLASVRALSSGVERFLPALVDGYQKAKAAGHSVAPVGPHQIRELRVALKSIQQEVQYANTIIDILLMNTTEKPLSAANFHSFRISEAISDALGRFPFNNSTEKELISANLSQDFVVTGPRILLVHVFFNLIKNGLYFVQRGAGKSLVIETLPGARFNSVQVTDTGTGISEEVRSRIFDRFFTGVPNGQGAGIGLSFCKMVMESLGGDIHCESKEGEYTTFRLTFPAVNETEKPNGNSQPVPATSVADDRPA